MLKPKRSDSDAGHGRRLYPDDDFLYLDGRTIASAVFRFLIWSHGGWSGAANRDGMLAVLDLFLERWAGQIFSVTQPEPMTGRLRTTPVSGASIAALRELVGSAPNLPLRLGGWIDEPHFIKAAPCLRLDEVGGFGVMSLELPHDAPELVSFADKVTDQALQMDLCCGVAGFGFFLPSYLESLLFALPMTTIRLAAAIEIAPGHATGCLRPDRMDRDADGESFLPSLPDIGWRTLVGQPFHDRLAEPSGLADLAGVAVQRHGTTTVLTAGPAPIWGRLQQDEDIRAYRRIADYLRPLRPAPRLAERHLFGMDGGDPERSARVRAYLSRFDD